MLFFCVEAIVLKDLRPDFLRPISLLKTAFPPQKSCLCPAPRLFLAIQKYNNNSPLTRPLLLSPGVDVDPEGSSEFSGQGAGNMGGAGRILKHTCLRVQPGVLFPILYLSEEGGSSEISSRIFISGLCLYSTASNKSPTQITIYVT